MSLLNFLKLQAMRLELLFWFQQKIAWSHDVTCHPGAWQRRRSFKQLLLWLPPCNRGRLCNGRRGLFFCGVYFGQILKSAGKGFTALAIQKKRKNSAEANALWCHQKNPRSPANGACVPCLSGSPCVVVADSQGWCLETEVVMRHGDRRPKEKQKFKTRPICWKSSLLTFKKLVHDISKWITSTWFTFGVLDEVLLSYLSFSSFSCVIITPFFWGFVESRMDFSGWISNTCNKAEGLLGLFWR